MVTKVLKTRESMRDDLYAGILATLSGAEKENFEAGLRILNIPNPVDRKALRESIRKGRPDYTDEQVEIFVSGSAPIETTESDRLINLGTGSGAGRVKGLGRSNPVRDDREALIASLKIAHPEWTDREIEIFLNPDGI